MTKTNAEHTYDYTRKQIKLLTFIHSTICECNKDEYREKIERINQVNTCSISPKDLDNYILKNMAIAERRYMAKSFALHLIIDTKEGFVYPDTRALYLPEVSTPNTLPIGIYCNYTGDASIVLTVNRLNISNSHELEGYLFNHKYLLTDTQHEEIKKKRDDYTTDLKRRSSHFGQ